MKKIVVPLAVITALIISSCGGGETAPGTGETVLENNEETCFYSYEENAKTQVRWTAFKTSDKVAVGGQFNQVNAKSGGESSTKITDILETIVFNIPTSSTNTENEDRDAKIVKSFFGAMSKTDIILGHVKSALGDNVSGTCTFYLTINNVEKETTLDYTVEDTTVKLTGEVDMVDFGAEGAVASLNEICGALHTGADGVTKTWSVVELAIEATLTKECH